MTSTDQRRDIPRIDHLLAVPEVVAAGEWVSQHTIRGVVNDVVMSARRGAVEAGNVEALVVDAVTRLSPSSSRPVLNATGIVVHTNLGRAPLSAAAIEALVTASGYTDVELDLGTGVRSKRGEPTISALLAACPAAESALVVNNGAAALSLVVTAFAAGRDVVISRGELIEIGAGFRLTDLIESTGPRLKEVGTTNRTHLNDYAQAMSASTGCVLKVHPSNYTVEGFTASVTLPELSVLAADHDVPLVADLGSGLLRPEAALPHEPDVTTALTAGADLVIVSGDKLMGGPQAGIILGNADMVAACSAHPLARAFRSDKLTLAALEATLRGSTTPVECYLLADEPTLRDRANRLGNEVGAPAVRHDGRVGGGGAPGVPLPGWAVQLPEGVARRLRVGDPSVLARVHEGHCLVDLRCIPESADAALAVAISRALDS